MLRCTSSLLSAPAAAAATTRAQAASTTKQVSQNALLAGPKYPLALPTGKHFWEKRNGAPLGTINPLLMFTLWHAETPAVQSLLRTGKGELYSYPLMEKLFNETNPKQIKKFYDCTRVVQKQLMNPEKPKYVKGVSGYSVFMSMEALKPQYSGRPFYQQSKMLAKTWRSLSEPQKDYYRRLASSVSPKPVTVEAK